MLNVLRRGAHGKGAAGLLVVMCHGVGADAAQMELFFDAWAMSLPNVAFLAPDGPEPFEWDPGAGRQWFGLRDRTPSVLRAGAARAAPLLDAAIDAECARLGLAAHRVALGGFSQGAMMTLHAGLRRVPPPLALRAYSGAMLPTRAEDLSGRPPVLLVHGELDGVVPWERATQAESLLRRLDVPVETCWRPGLEHSVDAEGVAAGLALLRRVAGA